MARYDPDRIAALAAGQLPADEAAALESQIAGDPRAAANLAAQRFALDALHRAPIPMLTAEERTELRRNVAAALNLEESAVTQVVSARRRVPWRPIAVAAAALAVIAGVVPLVGLLSVGGDQAAMTTVAEADLTARNVTEESAAPLATIMGDAESYSTDDDLLAAMLGTGSRAGEAAQAIEGFPADPAALVAAADPELTTCADEAAELLGREKRAAAAPLHLESGDALVWFVSSDGTTVESLAVFEPADCSLLAALP